MTNLAQLQSLNSTRWHNARVNADAISLIDKVAKRLVAGRARYQVVSAKTGVPWAVIAVIHEREAGGAWTGNIAQGDPWNRVSTHVPSGRGPFNSWEDAAYDALANCAPYAARWKDWTPGGALTLLEQYNGLGYAAKGVPSPYIWSGTDQYVSGKYIADHVYNPSVVDKQLGCAALLDRMTALDPSARLGPMPPPDVAPIPSPSPPKPPLPAKNVAVAGSLFAGLVAALRAHSVEIAVGGIAVAIIVAIIIHLIFKKRD
jgi:lysozyme family protein